jgi:hypothetical protein
MRWTRWLLLSAGILLALPTPGDAQFLVGAHAAHAGKSFGGTVGTGIRAGVDLPVLPFAVYGGWERYFPDCGAGIEGCKLEGFTLDVNFSMFLPLLRPYLSGGLAYRTFRLSDQLPEEDTSGASVGAGFDLTLGSLRGFAEARYELVKVPGRQRVVRLGLMLEAF